MVINILNLEGVTVLTKQQQKKINGGGYFVNPQCTGGTQPSGSGSCFQCKYQYQRTFLGMDYGKPQDLAEHNAYNCCPDGMMC